MRAACGMRHTEMYSVFRSGYKYMHTSLVHPPYCAQLIRGGGGGGDHP
jgi:hypothetical protein